MSESEQKFGSSLTLLRRMLMRFGRFRKRWTVLDGLAMFIVCSPGALLLWFLLDWTIGLPAWPLFLLFVAVCVVSLWAFVRWLIKPQLHRVVAEREAIVVEELHGELDNRLIGALQLGDEVTAAGDEPDRLGYSSTLVRALVLQAAARIEEIKAKKLVDLVGTKKRLALAFGILLVIATSFVFAMDAVVARYYRLLDAYAAVIETIFPVSMEVSPGDIAIVRGSPVTLSVRFEGARRREAQLVRTDPETGDESIVILPIVSQEASAIVTNTMHDFLYRFAYGGRESDSYQVRVADLPEVKAINYEMSPPEYTGQPMRMMTGRIGALRALPGTAVLISFAASTMLHPDLCWVEWLNGETQKIDISGRFGSFSFVVGRADRVSIHLTGAYGKGFEMPDPLTIQIAPQQDQMPSVQLLTRLQEDRLPVGTAAGMSLRWYAKDDYGIQEVGYSFEVETVVDVMGRSNRKGSNMREIDPPRDRVKGSFRSIFHGMRPALAAGDYAKVKVYAQDNNTETGPGRSETETLEFLVIGQDMGKYHGEDQGGFGWSDRDTAFKLMENEKVPREQDLAQPTERLLRTEPPFKVQRMDLQSEVGQDMEPVVSPDAVSQFRTLLMGGLIDDEEEGP